jgi:hypothetical protein
MVMPTSVIPTLTMALSNAKIHVMRAHVPMILMVKPFVSPPPWALISSPVRLRVKPRATTVLLLTSRAITAMGNASIRVNYKRTAILLSAPPILQPLTATRARYVSLTPMAVLPIPAAILWSLFASTSAAAVGSAQVQMANVNKIPVLESHLSARKSRAMLMASSAVGAKFSIQTSEHVERPRAVSDLSYLREAAILGEAATFAFRRFNVQILVWTTTSKTTT